MHWVQSTRTYIGITCVNFLCICPIYRYFLRYTVLLKQDEYIYPKWWQLKIFINLCSTNVSQIFLNYFFRLFLFERHNNNKMQKGWLLWWANGPAWRGPRRNNLAAFVEFLHRLWNICMGSSVFAWALTFLHGLWNLCIGSEIVAWALQFLHGLSSLFFVFLVFSIQSLSIEG